MNILSLMLTSQVCGRRSINVAHLQRDQSKFLVHLQASVTVSLSPPVCVIGRDVADCPHVRQRQCGRDGADLCS